MPAMPLETVRLSAFLPASPDRVYAAWIDSQGHSKMTGSKAIIDPTVGGEHSAWDGYITGRNVELEPARRIVQTWRSTDFPLGSGDSHLDIHLHEVDGGTEITIIHAEIPEGQGAQYEQGWRDHYLEPMQKYFAKSAPKKKPANRKSAPKKAAKAKAKATSKKKAAPRKRAAPEKKGVKRKK
jgi:activator of HSP90 ATPase